ncbi:hypothetical protein PVAND_014851 [Polypedilum vanderplanki]|uniref:glutathione transferase n=1 Tax=Polypedilum vanderplanki TaxID=319348 RepID=A0A9J6BAE4_POLVA|nr:hypothetical protein PVAND_014851 [Polypedilum vanderplanki]
MSSYKVIYYNYRGRAEAIRFLLNYGGIEFEDFRFESEDDWPKYKPSMPYGKVPVLEIDGVKYSNTLAICAFLGKKFNLAGSNDLEELQIHTAAAFVYDLIDTVEDVLYYYKPSFTEEVYKKEVRKLIEETIPTSLQKFETIVAQNGGHFVNGKLSWADIYFTSIYEYIFGMFIWSNEKCDADFLEKNENLKKLYEKVRNIESIKKWIAKRPETNG